MSDFLDTIRNDHHQFDKGSLDNFSGKDPVELLTSWLKEATDRKVNEPNAMALSTLTKEGIPSSRIVYARELLNDGIVFYTNYNSDKGQAIAENPIVHSLFFWPELERQISITGKTEKISPEVSDKYFKSRPKSSQIGAWASQQSEKLDSRKTLENRIEELLANYPNEVPRPPHWGGYVIIPQKFEFWQGRSSRLHDRIVFEMTTNGLWEIYRKNP